MSPTSYQAALPRVESLEDWVFLVGVVILAHTPLKVNRHVIIICIAARH